MLFDILIAFITSSMTTVIWLKWFWSAAQKKLSEQNEDLVHMLTEFIEKYATKILKDKH